MLMRNYGHGPLVNIAAVQPIRRLFRQAAWLALVAILALALAPTISHALAVSGAGNPWAEICTDAGGRTLVVASAAPAEPTPAADAGGAPTGVPAHLGHCPLCGPSAQALGLALPAAGVALAVSSDTRVALQAQVAPARPSAWPPAQPGAPPASA
jgi:hypothetical protein